MKLTLTNSLKINYDKRYIMSYFKLHFDDSTSFSKGPGISFNIKLIFRNHFFIIYNNAYIYILIN